jgi:hypothetical protein
MPESDRSTRDLFGDRAREYARVVGFALPSLLETPANDGSWSLDERRRAVVGLVRSTIPYVTETVRDVMDTVGLRRAAGR